MHPPDVAIPPLRAIPESMRPRTVAQVDARLDAIRAEYGVALPLAIESGSRAWGYPSLDSDYDCRFVFVRPLDAYLTPWLARDVIETPIEGDLDVNGWDLGKALTLLLKGNAVILEWLTSPIVYRGDAAFRAEFLRLADAVANRSAIGRHYLRLGERQKILAFSAGEDVPQKKIFYVVRPAAALRWLRHHPEAAVAPMNFAQLMQDCQPPVAVRTICDDLLARKAATRELGRAPLPPELAAFIDNEFAWGRETFATTMVRISPEARAAAEDFFRRWVRRLDPMH
ncbi:nucleotidyltransferase domain-containing protein [Methylorubrum sp. Q1]|nr:nucleotidyltransferase domain-containing protein [Methylorubrum sp. Q1]